MANPTNPITPTVLSVDLLKQIDEHYRTHYYTNFKTPLLDYTPDSLVDLAKILYDYIIVPTGLYPSTTKAEYVMYLTKTYKEAVGAINPVLEDFIGQLEFLLAEPQYSELETCILTDALNDLKAGNITLYNLFYSIMTPLITYPYVDDRRINTMKSEADNLQRIHNRHLHSFILQELDLLTQQLNNLEDVPKKKRPKNNAQIDNRLTLTPEIEEILKPYLICTTFIFKSKKQEAKEPEKSKKNTEPEPKEPKKPHNRPSPEEYLNKLLTELEPHYTNLASEYKGLHKKDPNDPLNSRMDETIACVYAIKYAHANNLDPKQDLDNILELQTQAQPIILNYNILKPVLLACMQIYLYNLNISDILPPAILNHGIIQGIIAATKRPMAQIVRRQHIDCKPLAKALYDEILTHTHGFATALPLPDIAPLTAEEMVTKTKELLHREAVPQGDIAPFDAVTYMARVMHELNADMVTTDTEVLSEVPDPDTLTPVTVPTIKEIAELIVGRACTPYLLDGDLIIHDETADIYHKLVPNMTGVYPTYGFQLHNHSRLSTRIYKKQQLLKASPDYLYNYGTHYDDNTIEYTDGDLGHIDYKPLPAGDPQKRHELIRTLSEWDKTLTDRINETFYDFKEDEIHAKAQTELRQILSIKYYHSKVHFLQSYKLAAYTYYPQEYSDMIINRPLDPITGERVMYHIHHVGGKGSEHNSSKENLKIITSRLNNALRYTSIPVIYEGKRHLTLKDYCEYTNAGHNAALSGELNKAKKEAKTLADVRVFFNRRIYTIDPVTEDVIAIDDPLAPQITFNGTKYENLKEFTDEFKLKYDTIQTGIKRARKAGKPEYNHTYKNKRYRFYPTGINDVDIIRVK